MLPMAHMYGLAFEVLNSVNKGCHVHFLTRTPSPKIIAEAFATIRPALILAVPLIIEKIIKNKVFPELEKPLIKLLLKVPYIDQKVREKIAQKLEASFGGNFGEIVIGGAAINKEVETFLKSIDFRYTVGYGMTECGPLVSYEQWDTFKQGSVGRVVDRMEIRIDSNDPENEVGEILVRGMNVMLGYYKNPEATKAVMLPDGWLRTGDLGTLDKDGFLYIRGRSKSMILSSNGQNIYPEEIEDRLNNMLYVAESLKSYSDYPVAAATASYGAMTSGNAANVAAHLRCKEWQDAEFNPATVISNGAEAFAFNLYPQGWRLYKSGYDYCANSGNVRFYCLIPMMGQTTASKMALWRAYCTTSADMVFDDGFDVGNGSGAAVRCVKNYENF